MINEVLHLGAGNYNSAKVEKLGKTNKAKNMVSTRLKCEASFNQVASQCDKAINQKLSRKAKRKAKFEARQNL